MLAKMEEGDNSGKREPFDIFSHFRLSSAVTGGFLSGP